MNPFSAFTWLWRAWRGQSVTFALLFGLGVLGVSALGWIRGWLREVEVSVLGLVVFPMVVLGLLSRWEKRWWPEEARRRTLARAIVLGCVGLAVGIAFVRRGQE